jgi:hypothetical protein
MALTSRFDDAAARDAPIAQTTSTHPKSVRRIETEACGTELMVKSPIFGDCPL